MNGTSLKHSRLGIASFAIAIIEILYFFILIIVAGVIQTTTPGGMTESSQQAVIIGLFLFLGIIICIIGTGLGIAGLLVKDRKRIFSILGLAINALIILGIIGLIVLGQSARM